MTSFVFRVFVCMGPSCSWASQGALVVKNPPATAADTRDAGSIPGGEGGDPLEEGTATRPSALAWKISWTEEPGGLWSTGSRRVGQY